MTGVIWWRVALVVALVAGALYIRKVIVDNATLRQDLTNASQQITTLGERAAALEATTAANDTFDAGTRQATGKVEVILREARKTDEPTAAVLDTRLPAALRERVFANDDPTDTATPAGGAARAGSDRGPVQLDRDLESRSRLDR